MTPRLGRTAPGPRFSAGRAEDPETALGLAIRPLAPGLPRLLGPQLSSGMPPHEKPTPKPWVEFARDSLLEGDGFEPSVPPQNSFGCPVDPPIHLPQYKPAPSRQEPMLRIHIPPAASRLRT